MLVAAVMVLAVFAECAAQSEDAAGELEIKAAYLFKFGTYVEWPPSTFAGPEAPLVIGVIGADELGDELTRLVAGRTVHNRPVSVRKLKRGASLAGIHILHVGRAEGARAADSVTAARGLPILVVTDSVNAFEQGGTINFVLVGDKLRFDVAPPSSEVGNLKISSRLLSVARKVVTGRPS
jgi:hypothetical protein